MEAQQARVSLAPSHPSGSVLEVMPDTGALTLYTCVNYTVSEHRFRCATATIASQGWRPQSTL